ncbi:hypothetical protein GCM10008904_00480 [Paraclostridium ghonii]|uniref:Uncharacterized protein n=1 Tax=Paraclostridium ghonii TaxID=29358 RepID=A0ABU0MYQ7_9FIRM|nr:hypothetical protein [Paeniclostridium ghonii]MDQ0555849.1 hypothetical protein [Paeniclostridium ghonii]
MKKCNNYINFGIFLNGICLLGNHINVLPEFIKGLCFGLSFILILIGIYSENHDISKLRDYKKMLFSRLLSK